MNIFKPKTWFLSEEEIKRSDARAIKNERDMDERLADIDLEYGHITADEHEKRVATLNGEPYVRVVNVDLDQDAPGTGHFELDFNEHFVDFLAKNGYEGVEEGEIVDSWFNDLCTNIVINNLEDENGNLKSYDTTSKEGAVIQRMRRDDGKAEYS